MQNNPAHSASWTPRWRWVFVANLVCAAAGTAFLPWVFRSPAALTLTAPDLAEFVKFLPEVRSGALHVNRLLFLAPLLVITLTLPFVATAERLRYPKPVRLALLACVFPLGVTLLPPVWSPAVLTDPEFRFQTTACVASMVLAAASRWLPSLPDRWLTPTLGAVWLAAPVLAIWQFWRVLHAISAAYASPVSPGWGAWLVVAGSVGMAVSWYLCRPAVATKE